MPVLSDPNFGTANRFGTEKATVGILNYTLIAPGALVVKGFEYYITGADIEDALPSSYP